MKTQIIEMHDQVKEIHTRITGLPCIEHTKEISETNGYMKSLTIILSILTTVIGAVVIKAFVFI